MGLNSMHYIYNRVELNPQAGLDTASNMVDLALKISLSVVKLQLDFTQTSSQDDATWFPPPQKKKKKL